MENGYIWTINGCELELDMEDADTAERYISALKVFEKVENAEFTDLPEKIRFYCKTYREFYDTLFGTGTAEKIFSGIKDNYRKYDEIFNSFLEFISSQNASATDRMEKLTKRYAPKKSKR